MFLLMSYFTIQTLEFHSVQKMSPNTHSIYTDANLKQLCLKGQNMTSRKTKSVSVPLQKKF